MRIERIDEKTVKCYLSMEELEEYDITYKDFVLRSPKAKEMVEQIIAQAIEEVGYKPPEFAMDMQIMMMPDKGMILTLSEKTPDEIRNNPVLMEYLREMKRIFEEKLQQEGNTPEGMQAALEKLLGAGTLGVSAGKAGGQTAAFGIGTSQNAPDNVQGSGAITPSGSTAGKSHSHQSQAQPEYAIFAFPSLREICNYVKVLPKNLRVSSCLYVERGTYYLYIHKGAAAYKRYSKACILAMEYGTLYGATMDKVTYLQEHGECLIPEKAIQRLRL